MDVEDVLKEYPFLSWLDKGINANETDMANGVIGLRNWHLIFLGFSGVISIVVLLCCCFRFRIPRTKQEIEADYQRRIIAQKFRERLAHIKNSEMDDMDLQKALDRIREDFIVDTQQALNKVPNKKAFASKKLKI